MLLKDCSVCTVTFPTKANIFKATALRHHGSALLHQLRAGLLEYKCDKHVITGTMILMILDCKLPCQVAQEVFFGIGGVCFSTFFPSNKLVFCGTL